LKDSTFVLNNCVSK